jgi:zinc/manganese transport system ATP-binding protein
LRFAQVAASRDGRTIWDQASFTVEPGAIVAVIGPNGSGKTTLLQLILGLLEPSSGTLTVLGEDPANANRRIGYVPQHSNAIQSDYIRARELVSLGVSGSRWGVRPATRADHDLVESTLRAVDAHAFAHRRMSQLSGGQRQRIAIAQALVREPELLILDEPLASLDIRSQQELVSLLRRLHEQRGMGIIIVTHDLNPLLSILTSVIYLLDGHAHHAPVDQVVSDELLTHLYGTQVKVVRTAQGDLFTRSI